ncbi:MAG: septum formation initiator family protein [Bacillota bacterium]
MQNTERKKTGARKFRGFWVLIALVVVSFAIRQTEVIRIKRRIEEVKAEIDYLRISNNALEQQIEIMKTPEYIEEIAREKLGLVMPGEVQYIPIKNHTKE